MIKNLGLFLYDLNSWFLRGGNGLYSRFGFFTLSVHRMRTAVRTGMYDSLNIALEDVFALLR